VVDPPGKRKHIPENLLNYFVRVPALFRGWPPDLGLQLVSAPKLPGGAIPEAGPSVHNEINHTIPEAAHFSGRDLETRSRKRVMVMGAHRECPPAVIR
jgi:hypothetical protein